ncbi:class F sortase [Streptomyces sp. NBC_01429]|uniref:class F sortase n=1 Tax=Streptomyces sp. NPDC091212 TaxID=3155191 RepID=UPI002E2937AD|nr:class F sortase [Streptomyces sp. NBC_01429]
MLTGCSATAAPAARTDSSAAASASASASADVPGPGPDSDSGSGAGSGQGAEGALPPTKVDIPSVGITSSLMVLGLNTDGTVEVPPAEKGMTAGWYAGGPVPGEAGPAVIIGHNDTRFGKAVFHDLKKIAKGAAITVTNNAGESSHFTVTGTESVGKGTFPTEKVYGATKDRALRLITCDGAFDAQGHPVNNLIVYATLD